MSIASKITKYCKSGRVCDRVTVERNDNGHWFYRRRNIGVNLVSNVNWNSAVECAHAAAIVVASERGKSKLDLPGHLRATMLAKWEKEGAEAYLAGTPWKCWNNHQRDGYNAARAAGVAVFDWPSRQVVAHG